ncbi:DUF3616 domain-containing protein [Polaromonas sp. CG_9.11]|uniref:DUF3616 domain-containing protein n=1 Tax=Polaromonas sp. CG_9.11 TaxID=2787730 RepID=UPI0018C9F64F|nr:DUF3616 domain-containing protein [Polaromonas sp. CG_9.11]MBG6077641.1 hypothetical protein [Polaromonas sp. CG_9.11]
MTRPKARWLQLLLAVNLSLGLSAGVVAQPAPPSVKPDSGPWDSGAGFHFDLTKKKLQKTRQSVSGIACNLDAAQQRICLLAFDEGAEARYAHVGRQAWRMDAEPVVLRDTTDELDAEAAATDGRYFYVTGSHSAKRGDCASNPGSRHVIRFRLDPATGRALRSPTGALVDHADSGRLWPLMQAQAELAPYVGERKCLGDEPPKEAPTLAGRQGVNIEGMAVQGGRLYVGFRGPVLDGVARVLAVNAEALFSPQAASDPKATVTRLALGQHRGIRDMVAVKTGLLLLAGPDDSRARQGAGWTVSWWDGKASASVVQPRLLAALDLSGVTLRTCDKELKPEAITVLEETPAAYKLLVLSDGLCDGGPLAFTVAH